MTGIRRPISVSTVISIALLTGLTQSIAAEVSLGNFDSAMSGLPTPWQLIRLESSVPPTKYRQVHWDGVDAIEARADSSMALLGRLVEVDLIQTPMLCWRWRIDGVVHSADMTRRRGDDYAARVYLAFSLPRESLSFADRAALALARGLFGPHLPDGAINYVWDNRHATGTRMPNAYTSRAQMVVQRSGNADAGSWVSERVNILQEMEHTFGTTRGRLQLVAIGSDSDNTGESVRAGFTQIHFVSADQPCQTDRFRSAQLVSPSGPLHGQ